MRKNNFMFQLILTVCIFLCGSKQIKTNYTDVLISNTTTATVIKYCGCRTRYTAQVTTTTPLNKQDLVKIAEAGLLHSNDIPICEMFEIEKTKSDIFVSFFNVNLLPETLIEDLKKKAPQNTDDYKIILLIKKDKAPFPFLFCCL